MSRDDTPPDALPVRHGGDHTTDLLVLIESFRRECNGNFRQMREEAANANRDTQARLAGIEGRLSEGSATISKHDMQLAAVIEETSEHHLRLEKIERDVGSGLIRRIEALELSNGARATAEARAEAVAEAAAQSTFRRLMLKTADGAADKAGTLLALALLAILLLVARSALSAQAPGVSVPAKVATP